MKEAISSAVIMIDEGSTCCLKLIVTVIYCGRRVSQNGIYNHCVPELRKKKTSFCHFHFLINNICVPI